MDSINLSRRKLLLYTIAAPVLLALPNIALAKNQEPIRVDVSGVNDVPGLILAIKKAAGNLLPASIKDKEFHSEFAKVFVRNARDAYENGFNIPQWVLDKLPTRRVSLPLVILGVAVLMMNGVPFLVAVGTVITAVLASILIMLTALTVALHEFVYGGESA